MTEAPRTTHLIVKPEARVSFCSPFQVLGLCCRLGSSVLPQLAAFHFESKVNICPFPRPCGWAVLPAGVMGLKVGAGLSSGLAGLVLNFSPVLSSLGKGGKSEGRSLLLPVSSAHVGFVFGKRVWPVEGPVERGGGCPVTVQEAKQLGMVLAGCVHIVRTH